MKVSQHFLLLCTSFGTCLSSEHNNISIQDNQKTYLPPTVILGLSKKFNELCRNEKTYQEVKSIMEGNFRAHHGPVFVRDSVELKKTPNETHLIVEQPLYHALSEHSYCENYDYKSSFMQSLKGLTEKCDSVNRKDPTCKALREIEKNIQNARDDYNKALIDNDGNKIEVDHRCADFFCFIKTDDDYDEWDDDDL